MHEILSQESIVGGNASYTIIFLSSFFAGYLIPFSEEIVFILIGYAAAAGFADLYLTILVCLAGVFLADNAAYLVGRTGSRIVFKFKKRIGEKQAIKYENFIMNHSGKAIFVSRFIPTIRVLSPLLAGANRIDWKKFLTFDFLAAVCNVSVLVLIGYFFENQISKVLSKVEITRHVLSILSLLIIGFVLSFIMKSLFLKRG